MTTALCTSCNKITKITYLVTYHPKSIQETYIECEHCQDHTTCFVTDKIVRHTQKKVHRLTGSSNVNTRMRMQEEVNERMDKLKGELTI